MASGEDIKLEDTNMAAYASPLAKKVRAAAAATEEAWKGAGENEGIETWRVENFGVKRWPKERFGEFYSGDSYIVLHTYKPDPEANDLDYDVYYWIGKDSTQDEYGTCAYKTVELDDFLGGEPVQSREVQGMESEQFQDLFGEDLEYMKGGVASAFNHVEPEKFKPKLYCVSGSSRRTIQATEVPCQASSINKNDAYVLDAGAKVWALFNEGATVWEKRKANAMVDKIQNTRPDEIEDKTLDGLEDDDEFWGHLGGKPESLPDKVVVEEEKKEDELTVYQCKDGSDGTVKITKLEVELDGGKVPKDTLKSDDVFLIDTGSVLYVWTGKGASKGERQYAVPLILDQEDGKYARRPVRKCPEGKETKAFKMLIAA